MFHTEELQQIINQLQHSQGDGLGYFDTLLLIFKLIGLCAGPVLFVISSILILIWVPKWISYKSIPTTDTMKFYVYSFKLKRDKNKDYLESIDCEETDEYKKLLNKRGLFRYKITCGFSVVPLLLSTPFIFNEHTSLFTYAFMFMIIINLVCIYVVHNDSFGIEWWSAFAKENPLNKTEIENQFQEKVMNAFGTIDQKKLKKLSEEEVAKIINTDINDQYCKLSIIDKR